MSKFSEYVTSTAFSLTLSKPMIECLSQMDQYGKSWVNIATCHALENRGLVSRERYSTDIPETLDLNPWCGLTEAGKAIIPVLKLAGLYVRLPERVPGVDLPKFDVKIKPEFTK